MFVLPPAAEPLVQSFATAFTRPTFKRFVHLLVGSIITFGRRTVSRILWAMGGAVGEAGHPSSYHRFFSHARWSLWPLARTLAGAVLALVDGEQPVQLAVDDTVFQHRGRHVYGKGCHRDAVRSPGDPTQSVRKWGHKWVVLAVLVRFPFASRPWALPVLCALYRVPRVDQQEAARHKTSCDLARQMMAVLLHWFPDRRFILLGDGGFASHDLALFCHRHRDRLTLIARGRGKLNLHALPGPVKPPCRQTLWRRRKGQSKPRCRKGKKLPHPADTVMAARLGRGLAPGGGSLPTRMICWYSQSKRQMELASACGGWYRGLGNGKGALVPLRWVYTCDPLSGREDWFICTDVKCQPASVVEFFAGRWSIEATFEEGRAHLGWESTRQRCRKSVLRSAPCLLGLFSVVSLLFAKRWKAKDRQRQVHQTPCYTKHEITFSDAIYGVRKLLWRGCMLKHVIGPRRITTLPPKLKRTLVTYLAQAG